MPSTLSPLYIYVYIHTFVVWITLPTFSIVMICKLILSVSVCVLSFRVRCDQADLWASQTNTSFIQCESWNTYWQLLMVITMISKGQLSWCPRDYIFNKLHAINENWSVLIGKVWMSENRYVQLHIYMYICSWEFLYELIPRVWAHTSSKTPSLPYTHFKRIIWNALSQRVRHGPTCCILFDHNPGEATASLLHVWQWNQQSVVNTTSQCP